LFHHINKFLKNSIQRRSLKIKTKLQQYYKSVIDSKLSANFTKNVIEEKNSQRLFIRNLSDLNVTKIV
jgi:hypothetical protein